MMEKDPLTEFSHRPDFWRFRIKADGGEYSISLRVPCWSKGVSLTVDGEKVEAKPQNGYITLIRNWAGQEIVVDFKLAIAAIQLKDSPRFAFREGPIALAGIIDREVSLNGSPDHLEAIIRPYAEREWDFWRNRFTTAGQSENFVLKYLYEIYDEQYTVYFPFS